MKLSIVLIVSLIGLAVAAPNLPPPKSKINEQNRKSSILGIVSRLVTRTFGKKFLEDNLDDLPQSTALDGVQLSEWDRLRLEEWQYPDTMQYTTTPLEDMEFDLFDGFLHGIGSALYDNVDTVANYLTTNNPQSWEGLLEDLEYANKTFTDKFDSRDYLAEAMFTSEVWLEGMITKAVVAGTDFAGATTENEEGCNPSGSSSEDVIACMLLKWTMIDIALQYHQSKIYDIMNDPQYGAPVLQCNQIAEAGYLHNPEPKDFVEAMGKFGE